MEDADLSHGRYMAQSWEIHGLVTGDTGFIKKPGFLEGAAVSP
jgi:hypothetical protein